MEQEIIGTTTQTGPDGLMVYPKNEAVSVLYELWGTKTHWVPRNVECFKFPLIKGEDYVGICTYSISKECIDLLEAQRGKGYLLKEDIAGYLHTRSHKVVEVVGSAYNDEDNDQYLLDPISECLYRIPSSKKGYELYSNLYASRSHFIDAVPNAFSFLGKDNPEESAIEAVNRSIVIICGLGTGGGETALRLGKQFPNLSMALIDGGIFGPENVDRQVASPSNIGLNKAIAVAEKVFEINPMIKNLYCCPCYVGKDNIDTILDSILEKMDIENPIIQIIDEIDVTEKEPLEAKAELHYAAIRLARRLSTKIYVHWSLDLGASGEVVGSCKYEGSEKEIFQGRYSAKLSKLPAIAAMYGLIPKKSIGLEMIEDIKTRLKKDGKLDHISQSGLSAIGVAKIISTRVMLVMFGYGDKLRERIFHDDLRSSFRPFCRLRVALRRVPYTIGLTVMGYVRKRKLLKSKENEF